MRISILLCYISFVIVACQSGSQVDRPNVIIILTDDQGWGDFGLHDNDSIHTPTLDKFARTAVRLNNFHVSPVCAPTRASLLTGRYHLRTGTSWVTHRKEVMRSEEYTLAEIFKAQGYTTALFGKWHNGVQYPNDPIGQGFDHFFGFKAGHWNNYFDTQLDSNGVQISTEGYITDVLTEESLRYISRQKEKPFFCLLAYNAPHSPFQVPDSLYEVYSRAGLSPKNAAIYGMVDNLDYNVGRLLHSLEKQGLRDNTVLVFLTDNGPNGDRYNGVLRGRKAQVYEGGTKVPCWISWPRKLPQNFELDLLSAHIDLLPTLATLCELDVVLPHPIDGIDLSPWLLQKETKQAEREFYTIFNEGEDRSFPGAINNGTHKLVFNRKNEVALYHLKNDPGEQHPIADSTLIRQLKEKYLTWYQDVRPENYQSPKIPVAREVTSFPAEEAFLQGKISFEGGRGWANDYVVGWNAPDASLHWDVDLAQAGSYLIRLHYFAKANIPAKALVLKTKAQQFAIPELPAFYKAFPNGVDRVPRGEVYEQHWKEQEIVKIYLPEGINQIKIEQHTPTKIDLAIRGISLEKVD